MTDEIHNIDLKTDQIPAADAGYDQISRFALSFNGYDRIKDIALFANKTAAGFNAEPSVVSKLTLSELRACLFYEQRRHHHFGEVPVGADRDYINILIREITNRVENRMTD